MSYRGHLIDPTPQQVGVQEMRARQQLEDLFVETQSQPDRSDVHVRDLNPGLDLEAGSDNGWNGSGPVFEQANLTTGNNEVYVIDPEAKAKQKAIAIVAMTLRGANETGEVRFNTSPGGVIERVELQGGYTANEATVLLQTPIIYGLGDRGTIEQYVEADTTDTLVYHGFVGEWAGSELGRGEAQFITTSV